MIEFAKLAPERSTDARRVRPMFDEISADDMQGARRVAVVMPQGAAAGPPANEPNVVRRAVMNPRRRACTRFGNGYSVEVRNDRVVDRDRRQQPRRQRHLDTGGGVFRMYRRGVVDDVHGRSFASAANEPNEQQDRNWGERAL